MRTRQGPAQPAFVVRAEHQASMVRHQAQGPDRDVNRMHCHRVACDCHRVECTVTVCDTMTALAQDGMTMIVVTHEMGFARQVADRVVFMDMGEIVEINAPQPFFDHPQHERTKLFLRQILR